MWNSYFSHFYNFRYKKALSTCVNRRRDTNIVWRSCSWRKNEFMHFGTQFVLCGSHMRRWNVKKKIRLKTLSFILSRLSAEKGKWSQKWSYSEKYVFICYVFAKLTNCMRTRAWTNEWVRSKCIFGSNKKTSLYGLNIEYAERIENIRCFSIV